MSVIYPLPIARATPLVSQFINVHSFLSQLTLKGPHWRSRRRLLTSWAMILQGCRAQLVQNKSGKWQGQRVRQQVDRGCRSICKGWESKSGSKQAGSIRDSNASNSLPALAKKLVDKTEGEEYVDFGKLPPAKERVSHLGQSSRGKWLWSSRPDMETDTWRSIWVLCCRHSTAVVTCRKLQKIPNNIGQYQQRPTRNTVGLHGSFMIRTGWRLLGIPLCHGPKWSQICTLYALRVKLAQ